MSTLLYIKTYYSCWWSVYVGFVLWHSAKESSYHLHFVGKTQKYLFLCLFPRAWRSGTLVSSRYEKLWYWCQICSTEIIWESFWHCGIWSSMLCSWRLALVCCQTTISPTNNESKEKKIKKYARSKRIYLLTSTQITFKQ